MKPTYYANLLVRQNGGLQLIAGRKFKPTAQEITLRGQTFLVDISKPIYRNKKGRFIYLFEYGVGQITNNSADQLEVSQSFTKALFRNQIVTQLVAGLNKETLGLNNIVWAIMGAMGGLGIGWVLCSYIGG